MFPTFQDSSPSLLKSSLQAGESAAWWVKDKTGVLLETPIKMVDTGATMALESMEEKKSQVKHNFQAKQLAYELS